MAEPVPDSFPVSGVVLNDEGRAVAWSAATSHALVLNVGHTQFIDLTVTSPVGLASVRGGSGPSVLEVFDGAPPGSAVRLTEPAGLVAQAVGAGVPQNAVRGPNGWFFSEVRGGRLSLSTLGDVHGYRSLMELGDPRRDAVQLHPWKDSAVLVSRLRAPHHSIAVDVSGDTLLAFERFAAPEGDTGLIALPLLPVPPGFVQVLADMYSDRRLLMTFGADGRLIRSTEINALLGLTYSDVARRLLVGLQDLEGQEVVAFRWRWTTTPNP